MEAIVEVSEGARRFIKARFEDKLRANPRYSLRAFANFLKIDPSTLSQLMSGKRPLSKKYINKFADCFDFSEEQFIEVCTGKKKILKNKFNDLSIDMFTSISDWHHDAILELTHLKNFKSDIKWVAEKLGINYNQAKLAIDRLLKLELLEMNPDGSWTDANKNNLVSFDKKTTNTALKKYQKQLLDLSKKSIDEDRRGESRDHTSFIFSMDKSILNEVHKKIKDFEVQLINFVDANSKNVNHIQALQFSSFPILKITNNKKEVKNEKE